MTNNLFVHPLYNFIVTPAYCAEEIAFNPESQPGNAILREIVARVVALAAPFFFGFQALCYAVVAPIYLIITLIGFSDGTIFGIAKQNCFISIKCLFSSVIEMPQKFFFGPRNAPNYFGPSDRYHMLDYPFSGTGPFRNWVIMQQHFKILS